MKTKAVALKYNRDTNGAPVVTAKAEGHFAEQLISIAKDYHIPMFEDEVLLSYLTQLEVNQEIPEELYDFVVTIFLRIYELNKEYKT